MNYFSDEVTAFLDSIDHPLRKEIDFLRKLILSSKYELAEGIKWNGPNYSSNGEDRITMRIHPQRQVQIIFHRGAKKKMQPEEKLLKGEYDFLIWKENDRAIATFSSSINIEENAGILSDIVDRWIEATAGNEILRTKE